MSPDHKIELFLKTPPGGTTKGKQATKHSPLKSTASRRRPSLKVVLTSKDNSHFTSGCSNGAAGSDGESSKEALGCHDKRSRKRNVVVDSDSTYDSDFGDVGEAAVTKKPKRDKDSVEDKCIIINETDDASDDEFQ